MDINNDYIFIQILQQDVKHTSSNVLFLTSNICQLKYSTTSEVKCLHLLKLSFTSHQSYLLKLK